jgi:ABC-type lipoprotein export system ATPase subunit
MTCSPVLTIQPPVKVIIGDKSLYKGAKRDLFGYRNSYVGLIFQDYNLIEDSTSMIHQTSTRLHQSNQL